MRCNRNEYRCVNTIKLALNLTPIKRTRSDARTIIAAETLSYRHRRNWIYSPAGVCVFALQANDLLAAAVQDEAAQFYLLGAYV